MLVLFGCDDGFSPLAPTALEFAVHGFLDASADTQWVRVTPMRSEVGTSADPIGVTVILQKLGDDRRVELRDSLFWFPTGDTAMGSAGMYVHNYWAPEKVAPGAEYRLSINRAGHPPAEIPVTVPADYEVEVWRGSSRVPPLATYLDLAGVNHVPFVTVTAWCGGGKALYYATASRTGPRAHRVVLPRYFENCSSVEFTIVGSEQEWPTGQGYSLSRLTEAAGNYPNALGFVGGVLIKVIPYENCELVNSGAARSEYCVLRYNAASASISGEVTDVRCGIAGIRGALVELLELDPVPPASAQKRSVSAAGPGGAYSMGALVPGVRYAMRVWVNLDPWIAVYTEHTDTLVFQPGERLTYDVGLAAVSPCPDQAGQHAGSQP